MGQRHRYAGPRSPDVLPFRGAGGVGLRVLIEEAVGDAVDGGIVDGAVGVQVDVPASLATDIEAGALRRLLVPLVARAFAGARRGAGPCRPEVVVTAVVCPDGVEIEVAATGAPLDADDLAGFARHPGSQPVGRGTPWHAGLIRDAALLGGTLTARDCPEGGAAVTLHVPLGRAAGRRAA